MALTLHGYQIGDLWIDIKREQVWREQELLTLPKLSFDLLLALVQGAPQLVSVDVLMELVWPGLVVSPETVTQRIKLLRNALSDDSKNPRYIAGVRGRGYKILGDVQALLDEPTIRKENVIAAVDQSASLTRQLPNRSKSTYYQRPVLWIPAAFVIILAALYHWWPQPQDARIAVIPLSNLSPDTEQDYFVDGLSEELINKLSRVQGLDVTGRISSFYFKERGSTLEEIEELLDVRYVLQGGVRKSGDQLRITVQLMDTRTGLNQWAETYDRQVSDLLLIQDEIATAITRTLSLEIGAGEFGRPGATRDMEAFDAYLRARAIVITGPDDMQAALNHLAQALSIDPDFALASALRARIYFNGMRFLNADERTAIAARYANVKEQVKTSAPGLPELQLIEFGEFLLQREYRAAEEKLRDYRGSVEHTAASVEGSRAYGHMLVMVGRSQAAVQLFQEARRIEPLDIEIPIALGGALLNAGRLEEASVELERGLKLDPGNSGLQALSLLLALATDNSQSLIDMLDEMDVLQEPVAAVAASWAAGDSASALSNVRTVIAQRTVLQLQDLWLGHWAAVLGDSQLALHVLREIRDPAVLWSPALGEARKLPGFKALVQELALPAYWTSTGNWPDHCRPLGEDFECF